MASMLVRNMDFTPSAELLPRVAAVLATDLIELGLDNPGTAKLALKAWSRENTKWPSTADIVNLIKPEETVKAHKAFPKYQRSPDSQEHRNAVSKQTQAFLKPYKKALGIE